MTAVYWFGWVAAVTFGAIIGSFLNVVVARLPAGESIVRPPSHCPTCGETIAWYDNLPVFSWFLLDGECRDCGAEISVRYPLVEMLAAVLAGMLWLKVAGPVVGAGGTVGGSALGLVLPFFLHFAVVMLLLAAAAIDLEHFVVPHRLTVPGMVLALGMPWLFGRMFGYAELATRWPPVTFWESAVGWLIGGTSIVVIYYVYYALRGVEGLGGGDVTLMAFVGAWLGWPALVFIFFAASAQGTIAAGIGRWLGAGWVSDTRSLYDRGAPGGDEGDGASVGTGGGGESTGPAEPDVTASGGPPERGDPAQFREAVDEREGETFTAIPFGPFIVLSALEYFFFGEYMPIFLSSQYLYSLAPL